MKPCSSHSDSLLQSSQGWSSSCPTGTTPLLRPAPPAQGRTSSSASSIPAQCPGTGSELLPTAAAWESSPPPTGSNLDIHIFNSCTARTASHSAQGCGFRNSPHLVFIAILIACASFCPVHVLPLPAATAQLPLLWHTPAIEIHITCSPHHIALSQLGSTSHTKSPLASPLQILGTQSPPLQWHIPQGWVPLSLSLMAQSNVTPAQRKQMLPRECRRAQRLREHGWEGIFLAPLNTSCSPPTSGSPATLP